MVFTIWNVIRTHRRRTSFSGKLFVLAGIEYMAAIAIGGFVFPGTLIGAIIMGGAFKLFLLSILFLFLAEL